VLTVLTDRALLYVSAFVRALATGLIGVLLSLFPKGR